MDTDIIARYDRLRLELDHARNVRPVAAIEADLDDLIANAADLLWPDRKAAA